jgi:hypothetical protein
MGGVCARVTSVRIGRICTDFSPAGANTPAEAAVARTNSLWTYVRDIIVTPVNVLATFAPPMGAIRCLLLACLLLLVGLRYEVRSFVLVCKVLSSQTLRGVIVVLLCITWGSGSTGTKFCSAFFTRSCGRRQRASAGGAGRGAARAKTALLGGSRRADPRPAPGFKFRPGL